MFMWFFFKSIFVLFTIYILRSEKSGRFYIGQTQDIAERLLRHNQGKVAATKGKGPWKTVYQKHFKTRKESVNRELEIKSKKSRTYIERLIDGGTGRHVPT